MDWEEYRSFVVSRKMIDEDAHDDLFGIMGLMGECGELSELYKKEYFHGKHQLFQDVLSEVGDVFFYLTYIMYENGINLETVMSYNKEKLENRDDERYRP